MTTRFADHLLDGTHASRPVATAVPAGTLYSCSDHSLVYQSDGSAWATWATLGGGGGATVLLDSATRTSGDATTSSQTFTDTDTSLDLGPLAASAGDILEVGLAGTVSSDVTSGLVAFDAQTRVSAAGVNYISSGTGTARSDGVTAWRVQNSASGNLLAVTGGFLYTIQSGDLDGGTITLRLRWRVGTGAASTATLYADGTQRAFQWWMKVYPV